jgi:fatty-acyl-CoA synthase
LQAWNTHRHLELYYSVSCIGAVLHTVNPRLFPGTFLNRRCAFLRWFSDALVTEQITYIMNHAEDTVGASNSMHPLHLTRSFLLVLSSFTTQVMFVDLTFIPILEALQSQLTCKKFVVLTDEKHMPKTNKLGALCYETLIRKHSAEFEWPVFGA